MTCHIVYHLSQADQCHNKTETTWLVLLTVIGALLSWSHTMASHETHLLAILQSRVVLAEMDQVEEK